MKKEIHIDHLLLRQVRSFLQVTRGDRFEALYIVAVTTGLRTSYSETRRKERERIPD